MRRPIRTTLVALACVLATVACENKSEDTASSSDVVRSFDAFIEINNKRYEMVVPGNCGANSDGTYLTWAVTLDAEGHLEVNEPHMYAASEAHWSVIDFYAPRENDRVFRIYRDGRDKFGFKDGVLEFEGELGAGLTEQARVRFVCPNQFTKADASRLSK